MFTVKVRNLGTQDGFFNSSVLVNITHKKN